ncbi:MAG TPA: TonB-dependent receptor plug domain-containing protein, partial [Chitinophagaceae bacterium]|nr:TonB-dependent receptor plug domain-containing protein [Chitinophagaceae bacterium]
VTDKQSGEPLHSALVTLEMKQGGISHKILSGLNGGFLFKNVKDGSYTVKVEYVGFKPAETDITVSGATVNVPVALEGQSLQLQEVKVNSVRNSGSEASAFLADRRAASIQNSVSARAIEISPDLSVANVTQRVSGVSLERSTNGEGQYAIVRGMDKRYNYTLVNGIKIPSPDNKNRYVPLDIFPADLLDRLEVTKALTPNMEGDAIGGVVNMIMKDAPDKFSVKADGALGFADFGGRNFSTFDRSASLSHSPRYTNGESYVAPGSAFPKNAFTYSSKSNPVSSLLGLSAGGRLFKDKLGIIVAGSFQNNYRNINSTFFGTETDRNNNSAFLTSIQARKYSVQQQRTGLHTKLDFKIDNNNKINLYAAYFNLEKNEYRYSSDTDLVLGRTIPGSGRVSNSIRSLHDVQQIFNVTLNGEHKLAEGFNMNWSAVYSKATDNRPDEATLDLVTGVSVDPTTHQFVQAPLNIDQSSSRQWQYNSDEDKSGYLNFSYDSKIGNVNATWSAGGMYRSKTRNSAYDDYTLRPSDPSIQVYDGDISKNNFIVFNPQGSSTDPLNYSAKENVGAAYAMVKLKTGKVEIIGGARYENTDLSWESNVPKTVTGKTGSINYYDVLPSAHLKYSITKKQ